MTGNCPECGDEFTHLGNHFVYSPDHRHSLSKSQLGTVEYLILRGANVRDKTKHPYLEVTSTDSELLKDVSNGLGWLSGDPRLRETSSEVAADFRDRFPDVDITDSNCSGVWSLRTVPHPELDYAGPTDVAELRTETRRWLLKRHSTFVGDIFGSLFIDTRSMAVPSAHLTDLLEATGYMTANRRDSRQFTRRIPSDSDVIPVPHYDALALLEESGLTLSDVDNRIPGH